MAQTSARGVALAALRAWRTRKQFANKIISDLVSKSALQAADRAFALELFYGVLRNLTLLDFWIGTLRSGRIEADLRDLLRLGLCQLFISKTSEHAAVNETVELAPKRLRSIINAILRSATRGRRELINKGRAQPLEIRASHPKFLIERWKKQFRSDATEMLCNWNNQPPPIYSRINQLKVDRQSFLERYRAARTLSKLSNFVDLPSPTDALLAGDCYIQDPSTAISCDLLQPEPGEKILDACAAPGGKTSYVAELMHNRGLLMACDRERQRLNLLEKNLGRLGVQIAKIVCHDWTSATIPEEILSEGPFDRILLDAPCSNTGVMRRRVDVRWRLKPADFERMQVRQIQIVRAVAPLLKPQGTLVYSTCSLEREENRDVVQELLRTTSILRLEDEKSSMPFRDHFDGTFAVRLRRLD